MSNDTSSVQKTPQDGDDSGAAPELWIFLVEGNDSAVRAILMRMAEAGAICRNLFEVLELGRKVGSGGHATVYLAKHSGVNDIQNFECKNGIVAKVFNPKPDCATDIDKLAVIQQEISLMVHAGRHPNIVRFVGAFCLEGEDTSVKADGSTTPPNFIPSSSTRRWALVTEYLRGGDLHDAVVKRRFKEPRAHKVTVDLLSALAHIHSRGIIHRDVKAENLLLTDNDRAVLADFGHAALISDGEEMCKCCGSPGYAAPEVIRAEHYGIKADSFGAGVTLYFMICGSLPFEGRSMGSIVRRTVKRKVSFDSHHEFSKVSEQCKDFILQLLQKEPCNRPTAEQAASQIRCSSDEMDSVQHTWPFNAVHGPSSIETHTSSCTPEATVHGQLTALNHHDPRAGRSDFPNNEGEHGSAEKDHPDPTRDSLWQRGSFRGWPKRITRLMSRLRGNQTDVHALHSSHVNMDGEMGSILPVGGGRPTSHMMQGQPGGLQAVHSLWGQLSRGRNGKGDKQIHPEVDS